MHKIIFVLFFVVLSVAFSSSRPQKYTTKYDNVDLDRILQNDRLLKNYVNCLMERGRCTPEGLELKQHLPDALVNNCLKCSDKQKVGIRKMVRHLINNKREWWNELEKKYDPQGSYLKKYEEEIKKEGIQI